MIQYNGQRFDSLIVTYKFGELTYYFVVTYFSIFKRGNYYEK